MTELEQYFSKFRENVIGNRQKFETPFGEKEIIYADWIASGRQYAPIEDRLKNEIAPFIGNTHTETSVTGTLMTMAYHKAIHIIKKHVNAYESDVLISSNSGMTGVVNKFQRILGFKLHEKLQKYATIPENVRPIVFITHMEHHSNQTSWLETIVDLEIIQPTKDGKVDLDNLKELLAKYKNRKTKISAVTSCSNVTGVTTPYHQIAEIMHNHNGLCFVDFAASAPYIEIDMHPENNNQRLDALYFSPHKFLGGPGSSGVIVFDAKLYDNKIPDDPGGGTVAWTNPWGSHRYFEDIEAREDGGTPAFLQTMKVALCIKLKEEMKVENILKREHEILNILWDELPKIQKLHILADNIKDRLGAISFYIEDLHYNLAVKLLNDKFGIQVRGGCSCAGTYGHYLLNILPPQSEEITNKINSGDLSYKPGWVRLSIHPTMTDEEIYFIIESIKTLVNNYQEWSKYYEYNNQTNEFDYLGDFNNNKLLVDSWFSKKLD